MILSDELLLEMCDIREEETVQATIDVGLARHARIPSLDGFDRATPKRK